MTAHFILERLETIGDSASGKDSGNEIAERMLKYLKSHKQENEAEIKNALISWTRSDSTLKKWLAEYLMTEMKLK